MQTTLREGVLFAIAALAIIGSGAASNGQTSNATSQAAYRPGIAVLEAIPVSANSSFDGNGWGGNINRIVRTSNGDIYTTILGEQNASDATHRYWFLAKRTSATGAWEVFRAPGSAGQDVYNPPEILRGPEDEVFVITWRDTVYKQEGPNAISGPLPWIWSSKNSSEERIPGNATEFDRVTRRRLQLNEWYVNPTLATGSLEAVYPAAGINEHGDIVVSQSAVSCSTCEDPTRNGPIYMAHKQAGSSTWTNNVLEPAYRHAYMYLFPDFTSGVSMVGTADIGWSTVGFKEPSDSGRVKYIFDGIREFTLKDVRQNKFETQLVKFEEQGRCTTGQIIASASDVYVDTSHRTHIIYDAKGASTDCQYTGRHAIIDNGQILKDIKLEMPFSNRTRMIQNKDGKFFLIGVAPDIDNPKSPACYLYSQYSEDGDDDGTLMSPVQKQLLSDQHDCNGENANGIVNNFIATPRGGTPLSNYVDGVFAANGGNHQVYYRLDLTTAPEPAKTPPRPSSQGTGPTPIIRPSATSEVPGQAAPQLPTVTPSPPLTEQKLDRTGTILVLPAAGAYKVGDTVNVSVYIHGNGNSFAAVQARVSVSSNFAVQSLKLGDCELIFTQEPSTKDPSFVGSASNETSIQSCMAYSVVLSPGRSGPGSISFSDVSIRTADGREILKSINDGHFSLN